MGAPSQFRIDQVEAALIALLNSTVPAPYGASVLVDGPPIPIDVNTVNSNDFNAEDQLVINPPAQRVQFIDGDYGDLRDNQRLTYQSALSFNIGCFDENLYSKADERRQTLALVDVTLNQLAGARLALADGTYSMPLELKRVSLVINDDGGPVTQFFVISVLVKGIAQFDGANGGTV
jgi:hypothetical protein